jgi:hypothetical protein
MQFGDINAPGTFDQNRDAMLGDLKFRDKKAKNYFDNIIGGAPTMEFGDCGRQKGRSSSDAETTDGN